MKHNEEVRSSVKSVLDKLEISRRKLANIAGMNQATIKRYVDGATYSRETENKLKAALTALSHRPAISTYISNGKSMTENQDDGEFLINMKGFPPNLTALRVEVFIDDLNHHGRIAFISEGTIQFEYVADHAALERLIAKLQRMLPLITK